MQGLMAEIRKISRSCKESIRQSDGDMRTVPLLHIRFEKTHKTIAVDALHRCCPLIDVLIFSHWGVAEASDGRAGRAGDAVRVRVAARLRARERSTDMAASLR